MEYREASRAGSVSENATNSTANSTANSPANNSRVTLQSRRHMEISGVTDVVSFDDTSAHLVTECGEMMIEGEGLRVGTLDVGRGLLALDGTVDAMYYARNTGHEKKSLWGKLLK